MATARSKPSNTPTGKTLELGLKKLQSSGLDLTDAAELRIELLDGTKVAGLHKSFKALTSLKINYLDVHGQPISDWQASRPFYRLRYLETPPGFEALSEKKQVRYVQEPNTAPVAYFPGNQDWALSVDPSEPILITEGELKAAKACKEGFPTIGLGGVYNWRAHRLGLTWLPSLDQVNWVKRHVYIVFDSDYHTNPMVCAALRDLAEALQDRGSFVYLVNLPSIEGLEKVGLDDYLVHAGPSANEMFAQLLAEAEPLGLARPLWHLNDKYVYICNPGLIVDQKTGFKASPAAFRDHLEAPIAYQEKVLKPDGSISFRPVSAAATWLKWPLRNQVSALTYAPGQTRFVMEESTKYNVWPGWGVSAKKGDVKPFLQLLDHLFTGASPKALEWFLRWCAFPIQHPGVKLFSSCLIWGKSHGTGKSQVGYTLGKVYGDNFTEITQADLHASFNDWAENRQFVLGDDISGSDNRQERDILKKMITQQKMWINLKYVPKYQIIDCINYLFTSNQPDAFFLEDDDRRHFIHEVIVGPLSEEFYVEYDIWLNSGGAESVFHYLLNLELGDFNPAGKAFYTAAKERMISAVQSDLGTWCRDLMATPDYVLRVGEVAIPKDLFTSKELLQLYDPAGTTRTTAGGIGRELSRCGCRQVLGGSPVRLADGSQVRLFAVRNSDRWASEGLKAIVDHVCGTSGSKSAKKSKNY